jgi:hypothetical protein
MLEFDLETIYMDVGKKLDALLSSNNCLSETDPIMEEAKDYLKIVHSIINVSSCVVVVVVVVVVVFVVVVVVGISCVVVVVVVLLVVVVVFVVVEF